MRYFFDDLALPQLIRTQLLADVPEWKSHRAGFTSDGMPDQPARRALDARRARRGASPSAAPRGARSASSRRTCCTCRRSPRVADALVQREIRETRSRARRASRATAKRIPFLDPIDLRYRNRVRVPVPIGQGRDVLPDGRVGLDGRSAQGPGQALLHPAVPVPDAALREDRRGVHPPPHAGQRSDRRRVLPRHRNRRHRGVQRAHADARDHPGALPEQRVEHLRRPGVATATTGTRTAAAAASC